MTILLEAGPLEQRAALLDGARVQDLRVSPAASRGAAMEGDVRLGRVRRIDPALQAAFVDIGSGREGYLDASDVRPRARKPLQRRLREGEAVLVQVRKSEAADKGAGLTMAVQLPGRLLVLTPTDGDFTVSRGIGDAAERQRLRGALAADGGPGCILRTLAAGAAAEALQAEYAALAAEWERIRRTAAEPPQLLRAEEPLGAALRDWLRPGEEILALDAGAAALVRPWLRDYAPGTPLRLAAPDAAEAALLEEAVQQALEPRLELPSGAALSIVETPALTAVDVDSAAAPGGSPLRPVRLNLEAAAEIARQLRLRAIGGLVAVDFLRMPEREHQAQVLDAFRGALAADPEVGQVLPFSPLGLVELVRRRRGPSLAEALLEPAAPVLRPHAAAALALRRLRAESHAHKGRRLRLACPPEVAALLPPARLQADGLNAEAVADPAVPRHAPRIGPA